MTAATLSRLSIYSGSRTQVNRNSRICCLRQIEQLATVGLAEKPDLRLGILRLGELAKLAQAGKHLDHLIG